MPGSADRRLAVATANPGKLQEFQELLAGTGWEVVGCETGVEEMGADYAENALLKAEAAKARTGLPALGDDSGIEIEALDGRPGLHSARLADSQPERQAALLRELRSVPRPWRARFVCVVALAWPGRPPRTFRGEVEGELLAEPRGAGGFGYDPVFLLPELGRTFAELDPAEKHRLSHRGRAVRALLESGALAEPD